MDILYCGDNEQLWFRDTDGLVFSDAFGRKKRLTETAVSCFDAAFSETLNVVFASPEGELIRLKRRENNWVKTVILKSRSGDMDIFGLRLLVSEGELHIVYGLVHNGENMIIHQCLSGGDPMVVNTTSHRNFFVRRDETGCIYVICENLGGWELCVLRSGGWSRPERLFEECELLDILCTGYREFCTVIQKDETITFKNGDNEFEVTGENPSIVRYGDEYTVITQDMGGVFYVDSNGRHKIISGADVRDFFIRLPDGGEYLLCDRCRGRVAFGVPRLFLTDGKPPRKSMGESARLELTKRIIALEARISKLEEMARK